MIHDDYFEDPFPINITMDDLSDCYISGDPQNRSVEVMDCWGEVAAGDTTAKSVTELRSVYLKMVYYYMEHNFDKKGLFAVIHDAYNLVRATEDDGTIKGFFTAYGIDFSHMFGFEKTDLQIIAVPFDDIIKLLDMKEKIKLSNAIDIWDDDQFVEYKKTEDKEGGEFDGIL